MSIRISIEGNFACFPRPEFLHDAVSYDTLTPIAAIGLLEAVHWTPSIRWTVDVIHVMRPIGFKRVGRALLLTDVAYLVEAHFELTDRAGVDERAGAHEAMFRRRVGSAPRRPRYLGLTQLPASVNLVDDRPANRSDGPTIDLGWMPLVRSADDPLRFRFFRARLERGVMTVPDPRSVETTTFA